MQDFTRDNPGPALDPTANNVDAIARLERQALHHRTVAERWSDRVTGAVGTATCVVAHLALFVTWWVVNLGWVPGVEPFDPFPFGILTLIVSAEGVLLAILILISQNRMTRQADRRAHLDLQVSMLAEQELTTMLQMQKRMAEHLGVEVPPDELAHLLQPADVQHLATELDAKLPESSSA